MLDTKLSYLHVGVTTNSYKSLEVLMIGMQDCKLWYCESMLTEYQNHSSSMMLLRKIPGQYYTDVGGIY